MGYDFNFAPDRRGTGSLKYDFALARQRPEDVLPLWVADMDFPAAPEILHAMQTALSHGVFGYSEAMPGYYAALARWFEEHFGYAIDPGWVIKTPGVVVALAIAVKAFTKPGDGVLIQPPVYYPFRMVIEDNSRQVFENNLILKNGVYEIDFDDFERKIQRVKVFLLCSPHNPVGRVWRSDELRRMAELCLRHGVLVVSDEIHCDFAWHAHTLLPTLRRDIAQNTILCTSAAKTFNLAGLQASNIIIENERLRRAFVKELDAIGYSQVGVFGLAATQAAYESGGPWLAALREYLLGNIAYVRSFLQTQLPQILLIEPQGTFLLWLDFRATGMDASAQRTFLEQKAKLWLDPGRMFGAPGEGFQRINIGCPRGTLERALGRLKAAFDLL
ncbi:MAG: pyridoxal phosphate-dependent aminotransferase [Oscillospiraceae bacterium]|jgi:cystathionine beta-lyase|nr:pyridoxal phosphate-dependent aminotransferase [Oscillospiraceae bacterium]